MTTESSALPQDKYTSLFTMIKTEVMQSLFNALEDYSVDNRGDVGSWVREAAMNGLEKCTYILCKRDKSVGSESVTDTQDYQKQLLFDVNIATGLVGGIVKQAVEKMDKLREVAAKVLQRILYNEAIFVPLLPYREKLEQIVTKQAELKWGVPSCSFPRFVQLLQFGCYSKYVMSGLVISIGGLLDSLKKVALGALIEYLQAVKIKDEGGTNARELSLSSDILWVLQKYKRRERVIIPTLKTIEILFSKRIFLHMEAQTPVFCAGVLESLATELKSTKDFSKLYAGIAILGYIASISEPINVQAFSHLLSFLSHRYPKIRKACAEQVYLVLIQNGNLVVEENLESALEIVSECCWDGDVEEAKRQRLKLCSMANLETGQLVMHSSQTSRKESEQKPRGEDENASYSSLVGSAGF